MILALPQYTYNWPFPLFTCCYDLNTTTGMLWNYQKSLINFQEHLTIL